MLSRGIGVLVALCSCGRVNFGGTGVDDAGAVPDAGLDAAPAFTFTDNFDRADAAALGNGWIEANPATFAIVNNRVERGIGGDWTNNHVYRAGSEDVRDVEVTLEFIVTSLAAPDWPQVFVRGAPASFAGYYVWVEDGPTSSSATTIDLARKASSESWWTGLDSDLVPAAQVGERYRLRLRAIGANPVGLNAYYERFDGSTWIELVHLEANDNAPTAITDSATWGFDGHVGQIGGPYAYDNFTMTAL